jgi:hypothetical protein
MGLEALKTNRLTNKLGGQMLIENRIDENLLSVDKLAERLDVKPGTIYKWQTRYRDFPVLKIGSANRYYYTEVCAFFRNLKGRENVNTKNKK